MLSPLEVMKSLLDLFNVPGYSETSQIRPSPFEFSEPDPHSLSDDAPSLTANSPALNDPYIPENVPPVVLRATATFPRFADNALGLDFHPFQMHADEVCAVVTSTPQAESLRAPSNHQDIRSLEHPNQKYHAPLGYATPQSHVTADEGLVVGCLQDTCLRGAVSNTSGPEVREQKKIFLPA